MLHLGPQPHLHIFPLALKELIIPGVVQAGNPEAILDSFPSSQQTHQSKPCLLCLPRRPGTVSQPPAPSAGPTSTASCSPEVQLLPEACMALRGPQPLPLSACGVSFRLHLRVGVTSRGLGGHSLLCPQDSGPYTGCVSRGSGHSCGYGTEYARKQQRPDPGQAPGVLPEWGLGPHVAQTRTGAAALGPGAPWVAASGWGHVAGGCLGPALPGRGPLAGPGVGHAPTGPRT